MASRLADSLALAKRCERVGWEVENSTKGIKVYSPEGIMFSIHRSYSDVRSLANAVAQLERGGLSAAEAAMAEAKISTGKERTAAGRDAAARKTQELADKNNLAVLKAAGPYLAEAEDVGILWFAEKHPAPWMRWVNITPEIADYLLNNHNHTNRPMNTRQVEHYRRIILSGHWHLTHQGGAQDTNGNVQDSQHRLAAIIAAGEDIDDLKVPMAWFVGMPVENFKAIDEGLLRTAAQLFARGAEKNGTTLQAAIRLVISYKDNDTETRFRIKMPNEQVIDTFSEDPEAFRAAAHHAHNNYRKYYATAASVAAARYLIRRANGPDNTYVEAFFEGLMTGRKAGSRLALDDEDPRNVFRETMKNAKMGKRRISSRDQMGMIILSWNNLVNNITPRYLKFAAGTTAPRVMICADTGDRASACPALLVGEIPGDDA